MPDILDSCVRKVMDKGHDESSAWAICKTSLDMAKDKKNEEEVIRYAEGMCNDMKKYAEVKKKYQTYDIPGVDIFAAGEWNEDQYSISDIDEIVKAFDETKEKLRPYLKIGHGEEQALLRSDELPAAGYISRLYREGRKLIADFVKIPERIYEVIKRGLYTKKSAEIYKDIRIDGKTYPWALKAVALLGGETPAVHDLDDILALSNQTQTATVGTVSATVSVMSPEYNFSNTEFRRYIFEDLQLKNEEANPMPEEKLAQEDEQLKSQIKSLSEENKILKESQEKIEKSIEEIRSFSEEMKKENVKLKLEKKESYIDSKLKQFVEAKKIVPAQTEKLKSILMGLNEEKKFKLGEKDASLEEVIFSFINDGDIKGLPTEEKSEIGKKGEDLDSDVKNYMAKHNVSYKEALIKVADEKGVKSL